MDAIHPNLREYHDDDDSDFQFVWRSTAVIERDIENIPEVLMEHVFSVITDQQFVLVDIEQEPLYCTWMFTDSLLPNAYVYGFYFFRKGQ